MPWKINFVESCQEYTQKSQYLEEFRIDKLILSLKKHVLMKTNKYNASNWKNIYIIAFTCTHVEIIHSELEKIVSCIGKEILKYYKVNCINMIARQIHDIARNFDTRIQSII